ncbi:MAG: geranylgeranylglycerol-phosphate geranylgeranyltransferase [Bacteroidia bacterium]|nr:geranylgeranylglycerol-phosphate geranylgeranyltransferase [Bacteroidia bacterium]
MNLIQTPDAAAQMILQLPWYDFMILVFATVCITAAGYVINDYFDIKTDLINRGKVIVGTRISRQKAMMWHSVFNIAGVAAGFYVSARAGYFWMGILFLLVSGLLYFYSASYKRQFLVGNLIVSILTAMVPLLVIFYEWPAIYRYYTLNATDVPKLDFLFYWIGGFALFAFLTTLTREIIKDIEDFEGDMAYGRNTIPVVIGIPASKVVSVILLVITVALLYLVWFFYVHDWITLAYMSVAVVLPLLLVIYRVASGRNKGHIHSASNIMKLAMLTGILYSLVVKAIIFWNLL